MAQPDIDYRKKMTGSSAYCLSSMESHRCVVGLGKLMREMMAKMKSEADRRATLEMEVKELKAELEAKDQAKEAALAQQNEAHEEELAQCRAKSNALMAEMFAKVL